MIRIPTTTDPIEIVCGDSRTLLPQLGDGAVNAVITDPPFSERTHAGHDAAVAGRRTGDSGYDGFLRRRLGYEFWTETDIRFFVPEFCRVASGWIVVFNDHTNAPAIMGTMKDYGRTTFAPLPYYHAGRSCRLSGDGPNCWTDWVMVSRPQSLHRWGTLPGGYIAQSGWRDRGHMGGKPLALMRELVKDYTRPGDLVVDPFAGGGTTPLACLLEGRRCLAFEINPEFCDKAKKRLDKYLGGDKLLPVTAFTDLPNDGTLDGFGDKSIWRR